MAHWLKVEPKQSTLFFNMQVSLLIFEEDVKHAKFLSLGATMKLITVWHPFWELASLLGNYNVPCLTTVW